MSSLVVDRYAVYVLIVDCPPGVPVLRCVTLVTAHSLLR